jgi:hypothetical protein
LATITVFTWPGLDHRQQLGHGRTLQALGGFPAVHQDVEQLVVL